MVCIYCSSPTTVKNSRLQRRNNNIWRRRACVECGSIFTTVEHAELSGAFMVDGPGNGASEPTPLNRDELFIAVYESCKHRPDAVNEATSLTQTVLNNLAKHHNNGAIARQTVSQQTYLVLKRFDKVAATFYAAYHDIKL